MPSVRLPHHLHLNRIMYAAELPEWQQEKNRFYCEVPGDIWEEGLFMQLIKQNQEERVSMRANGFSAKHWVSAACMLGFCGRCHRGDPLHRASTMGCTDP